LAMRKGTIRFPKDPALRRELLGLVMMTGKDGSWRVEDASPSVHRDRSVSCAAAAFPLLELPAARFPSGRSFLSLGGMTMRDGEAVPPFDDDERQYRTTSEDRRMRIRQGYMAGGSLSSLRVRYSISQRTLLRILGDAGIVPQPPGPLAEQ